MVTILSFVFVLGILVFFHELGHFLMARVFGVGVEVFSLGFGPRLFGWKKGRTDYRVSAVPLGGYVKMVGDEPGEEVSPEDVRDSFLHKPVGARMAIAVAGPVFNLVLALLIFIAFAFLSGKSVLTLVIYDVNKDSPAEAAGIRPGDRVLSVNNTQVAAWEQVQDLITKSGAHPVTLVLSRAGRTRSVTVTPKPVTEPDVYGAQVTRHVVGIAPTVVPETLGPLEAVAGGFSDTVYWCKLTVVVLGKIVTGTISAKTLGGPIMIAQLSGQSAEQGPMALSVFLAVLSVNLGIINLFPIPVLDGGHLVFYAIEAARRKPLSLRAREKAQQVGLVLLVALMAFVIYNDIARIIAEKVAGG